MRWYRLAIYIEVILTVLIGSATLYGNAYPKPNKAQALGFSLCAGKPCFLTITPGITTWNEATSILSIHSKGKWSLNDSSTIAIDQGYIVRIDSAITPNGLGINTIGVQSRGNGVLAVHDFLEQYGIPCLVGINADPNELTLIYPYMMVDVVRGRDEPRLSLESGVIYFQLVDLQARFGTAADLCTFGKKIVFKAVVPWSGLRFWAYYRSFCKQDC